MKVIKHCLILAILTVNAFANNDSSIAAQAWEAVNHNNVGNIATRSEHMKIIKPFLTNLNNCRIGQTRWLVDGVPRPVGLNINCDFSDDSGISFSLSEDEVEKSYLDIFEEVKEICNFSFDFTENFITTITPEMFHKVLYKVFSEEGKGRSFATYHTIEQPASEGISFSYWY